MEKRKSPTKITPELIDQLKRLVEEGKTNKEISQILNIGTTTITTYKKKYNISKKKLTAVDRTDEIICLYKNGMSAREIAEKFGYKSQTVIKNVLNSNNIRSNRDIEYEQLRDRLREIIPVCSTVYEASKKIGCSVSTVRKYLELYNLKLKLKYELSKDDVENIRLEPLKYDFNVPIIKIPLEDRKDFITNKIRHIIIENMHYMGIRQLREYGITNYYINKYNINIEEVNHDMGLKHIHSSNLELYFAEFCDINNIKYEPQKTFEDCLYNSNLRFDYYLPDYSVLVEIQGKQHYEENSMFGGAEEFNNIQIRDNIKKNWCNENNFKLIYIKYNEIYLKGFLENLFETEIYPIAKYKSGELLETPEVDNQQPS